MAKIVESTPQQEEEWAKWLSERPECVRQIAKQYPPWLLYRMKSTGQRVTIFCYEEKEDQSVTLKVLIDDRFNVLIFERGVFGIDPNDLEECDLPQEGEVVGSLLQDEDLIQSFVAHIRDTLDQ